MQGRVPLLATIALVLLVGWPAPSALAEDAPGVAWRFSSTDRFVDVAWSGDALRVATARELITLDAATGAARSRVTMPEATDVAQDGDIVAIATTTGVSRVDRVTGHAMWTVPFERVVDLAILGDRVIVTTQGAHGGAIGSRFEALDVATGAVAWSHPDQQATFIQLYDGLVFVSHGGEIVGHRASDGTVARNFSYDDGVPWRLRNGYLMDVREHGASIVVGVRNATTGANISEAGPIRLSSQEWAYFEAIDGTVYASGDRLYAFDAATGKEEWTVRDEPWILRPGPQHVYLETADGRTLALDPATGTTLWTLRGTQRAAHEDTLVLDVTASGGAHDLAAFRVGAAPATTAATGGAAVAPNAGAPFPWLLVLLALAALVAVGAIVALQGRSKKDPPQRSR